MLHKIAGWGLVLFIAYYLFTDPIGAAHFMQHLLGDLRSAGNQLSQFASHL